MALDVDADAQHAASTLASHPDAAASGAVFLCLVMGGTVARTRRAVQVGKDGFPRGKTSTKRPGVRLYPRKRGPLIRPYAFLLTLTKLTDGRSQEIARGLPFHSTRAVHGPLARKP